VRAAGVEAVADDRDERVAEDEADRGDGRQCEEIGPDGAPPVSTAPRDHGDGLYPFAHFWYLANSSGCCVFHCLITRTQRSTACFGVPEPDVIISPAGRSA